MTNPPLTPFNRLARAHGVILGGDALVALALAGTIFFSIDPNDARWRVALYLVLTMAPFAVVAPLISPAMDRMRGGHRLVMVGSAGLRAALALAMIREVDSLLLFPLAFAVLILGKAHMVAKSAIVPGMVANEDALVQANSKLAMVGAVGGVAAAVPGAILFRFAGSTGVLLACAAVFSYGAFLAWQMPATTVAADPAGADEKAELRAGGIRLAGGAMGLIRLAMGFVTLFVAFEFRGGIDPGPTGPAVAVGHRVRAALGEAPLDLTSGGAPIWHFGVALVGIMAGNMVGAATAPRLRGRVGEERMLAGFLFAIAASAIVGAFVPPLFAAFVVGFIVAMASQAGKQAFDAIVQRDAPEANLGRSFGRFESRFQLLWVVGALIPSLVPLSGQVGYLLLALAMVAAGISYVTGRDPSALVDAAAAALPTKPLRSSDRSEPSVEGRPDPAEDPQQTEQAGTEIDVVADHTERVDRAERVGDRDRAWPVPPID